jgi:hypothetical protein
VGVDVEVREIVLRLVAPAAIVVHELEAPSRVHLVADTPAELASLRDWVSSRPGGWDDERAKLWTRALARDPGGVADAMVKLLTGPDGPEMSQSGVDGRRSGAVESGLPPRGSGSPEQAS